MALVDLFKISIFNDQITKLILEFQTSKGKRGRPRLDDSLIRVFVFLMQSAHVETVHYRKTLFEFKSNI